MADVLASVSVVLQADISAFRAGMAQARKELRGLVQAGEAMKNIGQSLTTYVTLPLLALGAGAVAASGKIESLRNALTSISTQDLAKQGTTGLGALSQAAALTTDRMKELEVLARQPGLGFEQAVQGDVRLRAVGISAEQSAKSISAFANAIATTGGGKDEFSRVTVQLAQLSAKGKVLAQDLRPIIEAAPAVSAALQKLYGTVDSETISASLKKQGQSSTDFIAVLTDELAKIPTVAGGLKNGIENLGDTVTISLAKIGDGLSKALNLPAVLAGISDFITRVGDAFAALSPATQRLVVGLGIAAAAAGPLLLAFGTLLVALPSMVAGFGILTGAIGASLAPIALGVAALAAAAYLIIDNWGAITAYFAPSGEGGRIFKDLASSVTDSASVIAQAFSGLGGGDNLGGLISASRVFKALFQDIAVGITAFSDVFGGAIGAVVKLLRGDFAGAADEAKRALFGLIDPIANLLGFTKAQKSSTVEDFFKLRDVLIEIDVAAGNASLRGGDLAAALGRVGATTGLLAGLREQLKTLKEALDTEPTEKAIAADNRRIESLEKQIDRLDKLGKSSKALADLQKALGDNGRLSTALGAAYDYVGGKASALESGIKSLVAEGFSPASRTVQNFVTQLRAIPVALDQIAGRSAKGVADLFKVPDFKLELPDLAKLPQKLAPLNSEAFGASLQVATAQMAQFQLAAEMFNTGLGTALVSGLADIATGFGEGIGNILSGAAGLNDLSGIVLSAIGGLAIQVGQLAIGTGIAVLGIKAALESLNPAAAIIGGIALVALGTAVRGAAKGIAGGGGGSSSITSSNTTRPAFTPTVAPGAAQAAGATNTIHVIMTANGPDLYNAFTLETDRQGRVTGRR